MAKVIIKRFFILFFLLFTTVVYATELHVLSDNMSNMLNDNTTIDNNTSTILTDNITIDNSSIAILTDNVTTDNMTIDNSSIILTDNTTMILTDNISSSKKPDSDNVSKESSLSSFQLMIGGSVDFIADNINEKLVVNDTFMYCWDIDINKTFKGIYGLSTGYSNCYGVTNVSHKIKLQVLFQDMIDISKNGVTPYFKAGIRYQFIDNSIVANAHDINNSYDKVSYNAFGVGGAAGIVFNIDRFIILTELDINYTPVFSNNKILTNLVIGNFLLKLGYAF